MGGTHFIVRLITMLILLGRGLNFSGIDSQVFLPIITAFCLPVSNQMADSKQ